MKTIVNNGSGYPEIPLAMLTESPTNPRRQFNEDFLKGLAATIRNNGVLSPLLVQRWPRKKPSRPSSAR
jgi:ParB family chromosome partitioning protein